MISRIISLMIGYFIGTLSPAYFLGKIRGQDIRTLGSGNAGSTNILRNFGIKAAVICFILDSLKGFLACMICGLIFKDGNFHEGLSLVCMLYGGVGAAIGHCFPFYLKFKGGKAVASTFGIMLAADWRISLICIGVFIILVVITRYISVGSIISATLNFILWIVFIITGINIITGSFAIETSILVFIITALIIIKHSSNIKRLLSGTENKLGKKKD